MKPSAGLLIYRTREGCLEVLLAHHGGPLWANKDEHAWSIFKGELEEGEQPIDAAKREFEEETGQEIPEGEYLELTPITRKDGKIIYAWAVAAEYNADDIISNTFKMEWPPRSGIVAEFPENDRAEWIPAEEAVLKLHSGQDAFLHELSSLLARQ